ncbi:MAG: PEP-CTERM sorting domain-containing protein, partial [Candidatus Nealsonbacteria bacterium]|nr:PEP-CTERM sorting domain-containing protein [Candidatus Nealsonbacteria bacterium]
NSWLPMLSPLDTSPIIGISLGGTATSLQSIAFGRDNGASHPSGGSYVDRWAGIYTLQYTQVANPDNATANWTDIGTLDYQSAGGPNFGQPWLRHRFNFDPVDATGIRILSPAGNCIDEIELYADPGAVIADPPMRINAAAGFSISYDGNEGDFFDENAPPLQVGAPDNAALAANGAVAFGSSVYPDVAHTFEHANDGYYGNSNSWLGAFAFDGSDPAPFIGIDFAGTDPIAVATIAFGRDNGNNNPPGTDPGLGGVLIDRWAGLYSLQYTLLPDPDALTELTSDPSTGWAEFGTIELARAGIEGEPLQEGWLRHVYDVATDGNGPILATGIRILTPQGNVIDEIEVNSVPEPSTVALLVAGALCLILCRRRRAA